MRHRFRTTRRVVVRTAALAAVGVLTFGSGAAADDGVPPTTEPPTPAAAPVVAASSSVTLPLFGAGLVVDISTDPGGNLVDVALNQPGDFTATTVKPNKVRFVNAADGVTVQVKARHGGERIEARAADLAGVSGDGQWSGDVFGNGQATTVTFVIGALADGAPDITDVSVTSSLEFTVGEVKYGDDDDGDEHASASVTIKFSAAGQTRTLRIKVTSDTDDDRTSAKLSIALSRVKGAEVPEGPAVGSHTWTGMLCDGTMATVDYTVGEDGTISGVAASPDAEISDEAHHVKVRFEIGGSVRIRTFERDSALQVAVRERIRCDAGDPTVNTPIAPDADTGGDHRGGDDRDRGDRPGDGGRWGNDAGDLGDRGDHGQDRGAGDRGD